MRAGEAAKGRQHPCVSRKVETRQAHARASNRRVFVPGQCINPATFLGECANTNGAS